MYAIQLVKLSKQGKVIKDKLKYERKVIYDSLKNLLIGFLIMNSLYLQNKG